MVNAGQAEREHGAVALTTMRAKYRLIAADDTG